MLSSYVFNLRSHEHISIHMPSLPKTCMVCPFLAVRTEIEQSNFREAEFSVLQPSGRKSWLSFLFSETERVGNTQWLCVALFISMCALYKCFGNVTIGILSFSLWFNSNKWTIFCTSHVEIVGTACWVCFLRWLCHSLEEQPRCNGME